ncbi:hypothetical protein L1987_48563 [Smallanthus sonchifolius]|uniref:Uncharacterized protein n=1 Tax=Smallanthus sonchifolius TaxID=185202 RepID=A0ACB9FST3_9ASTR|nr:hypothetical protein L1987_48563 [Smallanthus sonchifolius]
MLSSSSEWSKYLSPGGYALDSEGDELGFVVGGPTHGPLSSDSEGVLMSPITLLPPAPPAPPAVVPVLPVVVPPHRGARTRLTAQKNVPIPRPRQQQPQYTFEVGGSSVQLMVFMLGQGPKSKPLLIQLAWSG